MENTISTCVEFAPFLMEAMLKQGVMSPEAHVYLSTTMAEYLVIVEDAIIPSEKLEIPENPAQELVNIEGDDKLEGIVRYERMRNLGERLLLAAAGFTQNKTTQDAPTLLLDYPEFIGRIAYQRAATAISETHSTYHRERLMLMMSDGFPRFSYVVHTAANDMVARPKRDKFIVRAPAKVLLDEAELTDYIAKIEKETKK